MYDFDRTDAFGNKRELHVEKAKAVANLKKYSVPDPERDELLGKCKYFATYRLKGTKEIWMEDSFVCATVINGEYKAGDVSLKKGDTFFMSAGEKETLLGDGEFIISCVEK